MNIDIRLYTRWTLTLLLLLAGMSLAGCSEELSLGSGSAAGEGITLMIPAAPRFAGGETHAAADELKYTSLCFFAFAQDNDGETLTTTLPSDPNDITVKDAYRQYEIKLKKGNYKLYLVANCFGEGQKALPSSESELLEALLEYGNSFNGAIPEAGLPMSAAHSDFREKNGGYFAASGVFEYDGKGTTLFADMTFACAKITLEVRDFYDRAAEIKDLSLGNVSMQVPVIFKENYTGYGKMEAAGINAGEATPGGSGDEGADAPETITFYVPERYVSVGKETDQSKLNFKVTTSLGEREIMLPLGEASASESDGGDSGSSSADSSADDDTYLQVPGENELREIRRGTHYIYRLNPLAEVSLEIKPWSPVELAYKLRGPVYLHVERQSYPVTAGDTTAIWYDSDVKDIRIESPMFTPAGGSDPVALYDYKIDGDSIRLWVNDKIKPSWYEQIISDTEREKYDFFHIIAGPIHKRIMVDPLNLSYYLDVTPVEIPINARIRIASGEYSGAIPVQIHTNYPYLKIAQGDGWESTLLTGENSNLLTLTYADGNTGGSSGNSGGNTAENTSVFSNSFEESKETITNLNVNFAGLNSGKEFWKNSRELTFTVTGAITANPSEGSADTSETVPVRIFTTPNVLNYKIHFHADGWINPHIYVYQCLEFPGDWDQTFEGEPLASKPIGYIDGEAKLAALEYAFTGKIAFKGWDNPVNAGILSTPFNGNKIRGFFMFPDEDMNSWIPYNYTTHATSPRYTYDMDFCAEHRQEIASICPSCNNDNFNRLFPGIQMKNNTTVKKGEEGWWDFELTGVAVPGRTLILFSDGHSDIGKRFPAVEPIQSDDPELKDPAPVGLTLFDYPDREGWLWFNGDDQDRVNNVFTPEPCKYRIYWPKTIWASNKDRIHLWLLSDNNAPLGDIVPGGWENRPYGVTFKETDKYYHFDFIYSPNPGTVKIKAKISNDANYETEYGNSWKMTTFTLGSDGYRSAYFDQDNTNGQLLPGVPPNLY